MTDTPDSINDSSPLYRLTDDTALRPAVLLGQGYANRVSGLPAFYYWKDAIALGRYTHPAGSFTLDITRDRLEGFARTFSKMKSNGVGVPILMDHAASAASTLGWIVDVKLDGDRLMELHQFLGETSRDIGLRNKVSLGIDPNFVDGKGTAYGEAIVHSAVTPVPVVPGQGEYQAVEQHLAEGSREVVTLSLRLPDEPAVASSAPKVDEPATEPEPAAAPAVPIIDTSFALSILVEAVAARRDAAVAAGAITPAVAGELFRLLARTDAGQVQTMCLSRQPGDGSASSSPLALAVFDAVARNRPVVLGEATGVQVLSRAIPGSADMTDLQRRMIEMASG